MNLFQWIFGRCCMICGRTLDPCSAEEICSDCGREIAENRLVIPLEDNRAGVSAYYFYEPMRRGLHRFKYDGKKALGIYFGKKLAQRFQQREDRADVVTCVPRARDEVPRMYNQSAVIAKAMARELNLPMDFKLLRKRKGMRTQPQCPTYLAREQNAKRAYRTGPSRRDLTGKRVILVDDLYTSGGTARACCDLLKKQGAQDVLIYTALRADPGEEITLGTNFDRLHIHEDFHGPHPYPTRRFRRKEKTK